MTISNAIAFVIGSVLTLTIYLAVYKTVSGLKAAWKLLKQFAEDFQQAKISLHSMILVLQQIRSEMEYMRTITQAASPILDSREEPQPPIGRVGTMPPPFPTPVWAQPQAPDAKPEDTDVDVLNETDRDIIEAQVREELKAKGIEPDEYDERQAVVDEA